MVLTLIKMEYFISRNLIHNCDKENTLTLLTNAIAPNDLDGVSLDKKKFLLKTNKDLSNAIMPTAFNIQFVTIDQMSSQRTKKLSIKLVTQQF